MEIKKILFPTDFSEASENAFKYALLLADDLEAELEVVNIYRVPTASNEYVSAAYYQELVEQRKRRSEKRLLYLTQEYAKNKDLKTKSIYGLFMSDEIAEYAEDQDFDLIIMGTKGERNALEKLMGSVTTDVMLKAPCPVLAVPKNTEYTGIKSVAFATELKNDADAVDKAKSFSKQVGAALHIVHVEEHQHILEPVNNEVEMTEYPFGFTDFTLIEDKSIEEGLDHYLQEKQTDVLAMYIPKRKLWERIFHASFTKKMTFHTDTPLLVWRA